MKKIRSGIVVSNKMDKTVVVEVERVFRHPVYTKIVRKSRKFKAHDANNEYQIGDVVEIIETRPLSRGKCWRVSRKIGQGRVKSHDLPKANKPKEEASDTAAK